MKLTPLDIRHKDFKRGMRGYADAEVDEFLDEVADEYERLFKENIDLRDRVEALDEKVAGYKRIEETLQKTLINAQANAEEQKRNATKQSQLILEDAELKARQMVNEVYSERQGVEQSLAKLKSAEQDFRFKFRQMLEGYLQQLGLTIAGSDAPTDFARHAEAIKAAIAREKPAQTAPSSAETTAAMPAAAAATEPPSPGDLEAAPAVPREPAVGVAAPPEDRPGEPDGSAAVPDSPVRDQAEVTLPGAAGGASAAAAAQTPATGPVATGASPARERTVFGESDDLLADVDSGVNENEFKW